MSKVFTQLQFNQATIKRNSLSDIPKSFQEILMFMDYRIRKQLKSFTILSLCGADRQNFIVDQNYQRAFNTLSLSQKIGEYSGLIQIAHKVREDLKKQKQPNPQLDELELSLILVRKKSKGTENVTIKQYKVLIEGKSNTNIDLRNYLIRKSKKKEKNWYVLEAINHSDPETLRFAFIDKAQQEKNLPLIKKRLYWANYMHMHKLMDEVEKRKLIMDTRTNSTTFKLKLAREREQAEQKNHTRQIVKEVIEMKSQQQMISLGFESRINKSICEDLVKNVEDQDLMQELTKVNQDENEKHLLRQSEIKEEVETTIFRKNIFRILLPNYPLEQVSSLLHFGSVYFSNITQLFIYHHTKSSNVFKLKMGLPFSAELACKAIYNVQLYKYWNPEVTEGQIKMNISSENSCILYQVHRAFNEWYRCRDFLILSHLFKLQESYYIAQKSIEHTYFAPFSSITRGNFEYMVWKIESVGQSKCSINAELKIKYEGMLNKSHQKQMTIKYLRGFEYLQAYFLKLENIGKLGSQMSLDWEISDNKYAPDSQMKKMEKQESFRTVDFEYDGSEISIEDDEIFYSIENLSDEENGEEKGQEKEEEEPSEHQIEQVNVVNNPNTTRSQFSKVVVPNEDDPLDISETFSVHQKQKIQFDEEGLVILPSAYIKKKFPMTPIESQIVKSTFANNNIVLKDHWQIRSNGALRLINQKKIDAQNNVFSFILKTMRKNLFSGKGMLNISLPVEIFNCDSNIQRLCTSMTLAPHFLEKATAQKDALQRFKYAFCFGFTNSIIYFDVQKPFNPILGETYQGYIRGCPIYAEQTSHHPPISSLYFIGRGYKVSASLEAKVYIHLNSGEGVNQGFYHIDFDDGQKLLFQSPGGELSGLSVGERGYNFKGRSYLIDRKNGLFGEMRFQQNGGFFSKKKAEFTDEIQGQIYKVKDQFFHKFIESEKRSPPSSKQIIQKVCQITGRWPFSVDFDGTTYYDVLNELPDVLVDQIYPLNSNSLYREDLQYRVKEDLVRSQIEKQRLEVKQRGDRKLREKFTGSAH